MIYVMSGGQNLNLEVKNGTTAPASPKENTLWVNSSTAVTSWDFSPVQPYRRSANKNLFCYPYYNTTNTRYGITFTDNKDGTITVNGTATAGAGFYVAFPGDSTELYLPAGTYTASGGTATVGYGFRYSYDGGVTYNSFSVMASAVRFTLTAPALVYAYIWVNSGVTASNLVIKPQLEKGSTATSFIMGTAEGQVWFKTGSTGDVTINALKKNGIWLPVDGCKQYVNGVWTSKEAQVYQGGAWSAISNSLVLFDGTDNTAVTGGWTATGANVSASSVTITNSKMTFKNVSNDVSDNGQWYVGPKNKIDLTKYSVFRVVIDDISATDNNYIGVCSTQTYAGIVNGPAYRTVAGNGTYELDVASLSGEYYVGFGSYQNTIDSHSYVFSLFELDN